MKKRILHLLCLLVCFALFTGCSEVAVNPQTAIKAPGAVGIYRGVQDALEQAVGKNIVLKYPLVGNTNTAFAPCDFEGDGVQEMLAFYQLPAEGAVTRVNLIRYIDGDWHSVQDIEPAGSDIVNVEFCDLNNDGMIELCLGWNIYTNRNNQMCIYQMDNGMFIQRAAEAYTKHIICDIDQDKVPELGLALLDTAVNSSNITFYELNQNEWGVLGALLLDRGVSSYAKITAGGVGFQGMGVYLDAYKGADSTITELVYYKGGQLYNPFASSVDASNIATLRYCKLTSTDVNDDGTLEIPFMEALPGYEAEEEQEQSPEAVKQTDISQHLICWRAFTGKIGDPVTMWWYNPAGGYYLEIDGGWQGEFTVLYHADRKEYAFYGWNGQAVTDRIFSLRSFTAEDWDARNQSEYTQIYTDGTTVWAVSMVTDNGAGVTFEMVKNSFHLILQ